MEDRYLEPDDDEVVLTQCNWCNKDIYHSSTVYKHNGELLCEDCWGKFEAECMDKGDEELEYLASDIDPNERDDTYYYDD